MHFKLKEKIVLKLKIKVYFIQSQLIYNIENENNYSNRRLLQ